MKRASGLMLLAATVVLAASPAPGQDRREAGAHVHGSGKLDIVIESTKLSIGLDTPAADIIGFEHAPKTPEQKAKLDEAIAKLQDAGGIFKTTADAGCRLTKAEAGLEQPDPKEAKASEHADFNGTFEFDCAAIGKLTAIDLGYFAAFPAASKLAITIVTGKAQTTREASKAKPRIDLTGLN